jgi:hypothetical protein
MARPRHPQLDDRAWLEREYVQLGRSVRDIAGELGCVPSAVRKALVRHGLKLRRPRLPAGQGRSRSS